MFTGIIQACCSIVSVEMLSSQTMLFWLNTPWHDLVLGESIAVDGICLTVMAVDETRFQCAVSQETYQLTSVRYWQVGHMCNLERSLRASDRMGGHFVSGHVDGTARVSYIQVLDAFTEMHFSLSDALSVFLLSQKGCVAVNGVSLTINRIQEQSFHVMLVPHTLEHTNLQYLKLEDTVNIEYDMLQRMVARLLEKPVTQ